MALESLLEIESRGAVIVVQTSQELIQQAVQKIREATYDKIAAQLRRGIGTAVQEYGEFFGWSRFSPDKTDRCMERIELFLYDYTIEGFDEDDICIRVSPPKRLDPPPEGKIGWENFFTLTDLGTGTVHYTFLIMNGYHYLR